MTQEELNNKISDIKKSIQLQKDKLDTFVNEEIKPKQERLKIITDDSHGEITDPKLVQEAVDLEKYIENLNKTKTMLEEAIAADEQKLKEYETVQPTESTNNNQSSNTSTMSQSDKEKNAKLAAEHPERVVDGIYYANDDALTSAKEAYEKKVQEETKLATAEATANANKLAAAMKRINETLYGTDNQEVIEQLQGTVGGAELSSILGNAVDVRARQKLLDFKKFKDDFKAPNAGKPPHNKDPFPVDLKIEEFETHQPRVKVHQIITHNHGKAAAIMGIEQFDKAEKRLVRLENNMSTLMRYIFRLGARVMINCHYYGQNIFPKY